jgi:hypothetical protein
VALGDRVARRWCLLLHLLDDLMACDSVEAHEKLVWCSKGGFVRGIVLTPRGSRRATLVERVIELALTDVRAWRVMPISCRTTR